MSAIFEPGRIGLLETKNRLMRSPTCEWMCDANGKAGQLLIDYYARLAKGGVGLIVLGHAYVTKTGKASPGQIGLYDDDLAEALRPVVDAVHKDGAKVMLQVNHAGGRGHPDLNGGAQPHAPSAVPDPRWDIVPEALGDEEILALARAYGNAARRTRDIGFDGVQIHAAHGYLVSQFLSPYTNRRTDRWGGSLENRMRFLAMVCEEVRGQVGEQFPMTIKVATQDFVCGGLDPDDGVKIAARLADYGFDAIEMSGGVEAGNKPFSVRPGINERKDEAYFLDNARRIREVTGLPLMFVGGLRTPELMERMITDEGMDFVSLSRPLINDPDLPNKWAAGSDERAGCISCNLCLKNRHEPLRCWYRQPAAMSV